MYVHLSNIMDSKSCNIQLYYICLRTRAFKMFWIYAGMTLRKTTDIQETGHIKQINIVIFITKLKYANY
jgi:hypothetical protein